VSPATQSHNTSRPLARRRNPEATASGLGRTGRAREVCSVVPRTRCNSPNRSGPQPPRDTVFPSPWGSEGKPAGPWLPSGQGS